MQRRRRRSLDAATTPTPARSRSACSAQPPDDELIIGSAGGNEILASLLLRRAAHRRGRAQPGDLSLLTDHFADYSGHLADQPGVNYVNGDGRSYLARSDKKYDLVWYVAPDSYAATNAASSGAFVLSESYLYTTQMIDDSLEHLAPDGIMVVQFGELDFDEQAEPHRPLRR